MSLEVKISSDWSSVDRIESIQGCVTFVIHKDFVHNLILPTILQYGPTDTWMNSKMWQHRMQPVFLINTSVEERKEPSKLWQFYNQHSLGNIPSVAHIQSTDGILYITILRNIHIASDDF